MLTSKCSQNDSVLPPNAVKGEDTASSEETSRLSTETTGKAPQGRPRPPERTRWRPPDKVSQTTRHREPCWNLALALLTPPVRVDYLVDLA